MALQAALDSFRESLEGAENIQASQEHWAWYFLSRDAGGGGRGLVSGHRGVQGLDSG